MPKKIARPVLVFCLVLGFAFALWKLGELYGHSAQSSATREGVPVRVALVRRDAIATSVSSIGTVQALNTVLVRSRIDGAIEQVLFKEGQIVTQGEVLVKLDA